jgi:ABC-type uncharacterized transport system permease subunit
MEPLNYSSSAAPRSPLPIVSLACSALALAILLFLWVADPSVSPLIGFLACALALAGFITAIVGIVSTRPRSRLAMSSLLLNFAFWSSIALVFFAENSGRLQTQNATVGPQTSQVVGHYTTTDSRAPNTTFDMRADGTFTLANWPGTNGSGTWQIKQDGITKLWQLHLAFTTPQNYYVTGYQVLGGPGNYKLGFFIGDPDTGAVVLERQKP